MAAALGAISLVTGAVGAITPLIPGLVQAVEGWFGHSSKTGTKSGPEKMQTGVTILQGILTTLANAGKLPSAGVVDPSLPAALAGAIQQAVDMAKSQGLLGPPNPLSIPPGVAPINLTVSLQPGQKVSIAA